jgi:hypothetical protein
VLFGSRCAPDVGYLQGLIRGCESRSCVPALEREPLFAANGSSHLVTPVDKDIVGIYPSTGDRPVRNVPQTFDQECDGCPVTPKAVNAPPDSRGCNPSEPAIRQFHSDDGFWPIADQPGRQMALQSIWPVINTSRR